MQRRIQSELAADTGSVLRVPSLIMQSPPGSGHDLVVKAVAVGETGLGCLSVANCFESGTSRIDGCGTINVRYQALLKRWGSFLVNVIMFNCSVRATGVHSDLVLNGVLRRAAAAFVLVDATSPDLPTRAQALVQQCRRNDCRAPDELVVVLVGLYSSSELKSEENRRRIHEIALQLGAFPAATCVESGEGVEQAVEIALDAIMARALRPPPLRPYQAMSGCVRIPAVDANLHLAVQS